MGKRKRTVHTVKRHGTGDLRVMRNSLMWVACITIWGYEIPAGAAAQGHVDVWGLCRALPNPPWSGAGELTLVVWVWESLFWCHELSWQADQLSYYPGQDPGLWVDPPQHLLHLWTVGACEGADPIASKLQDLHDTGQEQDIWEESRGGSCIDSIAQARDIQPVQCSDSLQWTFPSKAVWAKGCLCFYVCLCVCVHVFLCLCSILCVCVCLCECLCDVCTSTCVCVLFVGTFKSELVLEERRGRDTHKNKHTHRHIHRHTCTHPHITYYTHT